MTEDAPQRDYALREVFNGLRWIVRASAGSAHRTGAALVHDAQRSAAVHRGAPSLSKPSAG